MIKNLKLLREKYKISQQKLAAAVGVSQQSINKYENHNIEPDISTLIAIADYFHTSVDFLVGRCSMINSEGGCDVGRLSEEEVEIIASYRRLNLKEKASIRLIMDNYKE